jgi:glycosyltransferase involved in cell wall biosynthesis
LFIGRFHPKKAIENLIIALSISKNFKDSNFILKLAGNHDNEYGSYIKKLVIDYKLDSKVEFLGEIKDYYKQKLYANAYFTIVPSHTENFCNVVIESLSQGTPVISSFGTPWEELEIHKVGFWIDNQPKIIAEYIDITINFKFNQYIEYRNKALNFVLENYEINKGVNNWLKTFKSILGIQ